MLPIGAIRGTVQTLAESRVGRRDGAKSQGLPGMLAIPTLMSVWGGFEESQSNGQHSGLDPIKVCRPGSPKR